MENRNTGVIIAPPKPKDWIAGAVGALVYEARVANGDWRKYQPTKEYQFSFGIYDTMSCVTFETLNSVESQINYLIATEKMPLKIVQKLSELGYFDEKGMFNGSDWFTAVMSGTTPNGNYLNATWESIRVHGILPQSKGLKPEDVKNVNEWLDPSRVTAEQKALALKFLEIFTVEYEWILTGTLDHPLIEKHLKQAPLSIATAVCAGWGTDDPIKTCVQPTQHATAIQFSETDVATHILDHYDPINKRLAWDYPIFYAIKGVLGIKAEAPTEKPPEATEGSLLKDSKKVIVLNAGHWDDPHTPNIDDTGSNYNGIVEAVECMKIRDTVVPMLKAQGYTVHIVPDEFNLTKSIAFANEKCPDINSGVVLDIHLNYLSDKKARGTEAFYYASSDIGKKCAVVLAEKVSKAFGVPNRGAKPDTQSAVGSLGWLRKTKARALLIECCFISNDEDVALLRSADGYKKIGQGIVDTMNTLFGVEPKPVEPEPTPTPVDPKPTTPAEAKLLVASIRTNLQAGLDKLAQLEDLL